MCFVPSVVERIIVVGVMTFYVCYICMYVSGVHHNENILKFVLCVDESAISGLIFISQLELPFSNFNDVIVSSA